jgi:hypothetical protein
LPSFANTQAATDGERGVRLVYYAFDLLHLDGRDVSVLPLIERKALLEPLVADKPGLQFNGHETGDGELILKHAGKLGFEGAVSKTIHAPYAPGNRGLWRKAKWLNRQEFLIVGWSDPEGSLERWPLRAGASGQYGFQPRSFPLVDGGLESREPLLNLTELDSFRHVREQGRQRRGFPRHELPYRDRAGERSGRADYVGSLLDLRQSEAYGSLSPRRNQPVEAKAHCRRVASQRHLDALAGKRLGIAVEESLSGEGGLVARSSWVAAWVGAEALREFPAVRSAYVVTFRGQSLTPVRCEQT